MNRRDVVFILRGAAVGWPLTAGAQQKPMPAIGEAQPGSRVPIVGVLLYGPPEPAFAAFLEKFRELGDHEDRNVRLEIRSADSKPERLLAPSHHLERGPVISGLKHSLTVGVEH
jgi:hypothetical protein